MSILLLLLSVFALFKSTQSTTNINESNHPETYIIYVQPPEEVGLLSSKDLENYYQSFLPPTTTDDDMHAPTMVYTYHHALSGFAARLTPAHIIAMRAKSGFIDAYPDQLIPLHTTHTPSFLGLDGPTGLWNVSTLGKGVIIGLLDTGAEPTHPSFNDDGMDPPPQKWKGKCEYKSSGSCNNKLIGARAFITGTPQAPDDQEGHGTHTASTAAGNFVSGADVLGNARGTASGVAPRAHLAMYKVCSMNGCQMSDIAAGLDAAIADGVDILSISLGGPSKEYPRDPMVTAAFAATQRGILVSCSAGNDGPLESSVTNEAPWILTVGASTMDRSIRSTVRLGDGTEINGETLFQYKDFKPDQLPLVVPSSSDDPYCFGSLDATDAKGKVVLCMLGDGTNAEKGRVVKEAGGAGMILMNDEVEAYIILDEAHVLPASHVSYADGLKIKSYIKSTSNATAAIVFKGTLIGNSNTAPSVAAFSSRGPSRQSNDILKPDIIGPGVNVLAAWPSKLDVNYTSEGPNFNIISGTSMSAPHLSGVAALLKSVHPDWSAAMIKSAILTTADLVDNQGKPIVDEKHERANLFATGAGHVNPSKAIEPGLVYDIGPENYISYLCAHNYTEEDIKVITQNTIRCADYQKYGGSDLNFPSFTGYLKTSGSLIQTYNRTVTNVGGTNSIYKLAVTEPSGVSVVVEPQRLQFSRVNEKASYFVILSIKDKTKGSYAEGELRWVSDEHVVRSPISVFMTT